MVNPTDMLRMREEALRQRNAIGAGVYRPVVGTPAPPLLPQGYGGGMVLGRAAAPPGAPYGGGRASAPPPPMPTGIATGGGYGGGAGPAGPAGPVPAPIGPMQGWTPADSGDRSAARLGAMDAAFRQRNALPPARTAINFGPLGNEGAGYRAASAPGVAPPAAGYGGGSPVPTGPGLPPSTFNSPYGSGPSGPYTPPTTLPPGVQAALQPAPSGGNTSGGLVIPPAFTTPGIGDVFSSAGGGAASPPAPAPPAPAPAAAAAGGSAPQQLQQNVPLPPPRPTAALAPVQAPLPPQRPRTLGMAPTPNPGATPNVAHVSGPAWLGALFRAGQQAPTGMSAMVNRPISDLGQGR